MSTSSKGSGSSGSLEAIFAKLFKFY